MTKNTIHYEAYSTQEVLNPFYTGWAVQVHQSQRPLSSKHPLLQQFGNLKFIIQEDGSYRYYFLAKFSDTEGAKAYFETVIAPVYPEALLVFFQNGKPKKKYTSELYSSK